jgi:hypothetical protein
VIVRSQTIAHKKLHRATSPTLSAIGRMPQELAALLSLMERLAAARRPGFIVKVGPALTRLACC